MQPPKFTNFVDKAGESRWHVEDANGVITGSSNQGFGSKSDCDRAISDHVENCIAAAVISISLGTSFEPIIEYVGYEQPAPEYPPEGPYPDQTTEPDTQEEGQDQAPDVQEEPPEEEPAEG